MLLVQLLVFWKCNFSYILILLKKWSPNASFNSCLRSPTCYTCWLLCGVIFLDVIGLVGSCLWALAMNFLSCLHCMLSPQRSCVSQSASGSSTVTRLGLLFVWISWLWRNAVVIDFQNTVPCSQSSSLLAIFPYWWRMFFWSILYLKVCSFKDLIVRPELLKKPDGRSKLRSRVY